jgi:hypothetical protein
MSGNASQVATRWADKAHRRAEHIARSAVMQLGAETVLGSPVDTGRFRGNWQFGTTLPEGEVIGPFSPNVMPDFSEVESTLDLGDTAFLINNLPYARALEYGHSKQFPAGIVRLVAKRWPAIVMASAISANISIP